VRPDWHTYFMNIVRQVAMRANCPRRSVGCVLVNNYNEIIGTGYNGTARGLPNCFEKNCGGSHFSLGQGLNVCQAIHAEANALLFCKDVHSIKVAYVSCFPCEHCVKLLLNTSCELIVYEEDYYGKSFDVWNASGRKTIKWLDINKTVPAAQ
jgi:dCMP deaminase